MKHFHIWPLFLLLCITPVICKAQPATFPSQGVPTLPEKLVLRLPYSASQTQRAWNEKHIGFYDVRPEVPGSEGEIDETQGPSLFRGVLLATDAKGLLYLYDPITYHTVTSHPHPSGRAIRVFDRQGREVRRFWLPPHVRPLRAAVTASGILWLSVEDQSYPPLRFIKPTLPVLAYAPGQSQPLINWMSGMPKEVLIPLQQQLKGKNLTATELEEFYHISLPVLHGGGQRIKLRCYGFGGNNGLRDTDVIVGCDEKGGNIRTIISHNSGKVKTSWLSSAGKDYFGDSDSTPDKSARQLWFWWPGEKRGAPLLTRQMVADPSNWFAQTLKTDYYTFNVSPRGFGHEDIVLIWHRHTDAPSTSFDIPGNVPLSLGRPDEHAAVILNHQRQAVAYIPWKTTVLGSQVEWLFPLPDGSGFYRQEFAEKELRIYFHPLPKT